MFEKWYDHVALRVMETEGKPKRIWDYDFQTDRGIEHQRPAIVVLNTTENEWEIIDAATPVDCTITAKQTGKISKHCELKLEIAENSGR